jgi:hypothetical protein
MSKGPCGDNESERWKEERWTGHNGDEGQRWLTKKREGGYHILDFFFAWTFFLGVSATPRRDASSLFPLFSFLSLFSFRFLSFFHHSHKLSLSPLLVHLHMFIPSQSLHIRTLLFFSQCCTTPFSHTLDFFFARTFFLVRDTSMYIRSTVLAKLQTNPNLVLNSLLSSPFILHA